MVVEAEVESTGKKPESRIKHCGRALLSLLVAALVVECFLRSIDLPLVAPKDFVAGKDANRSFEFDFRTMWRFPQDPTAKWGPSAQDEFSNRFGCRGYEPALQKGQKDIRVVCVGASGVSGFAMPFGWSFGILLERELQKQFPGSRVETVLAGIAGFSSEQQRALLEEKLDSFQADLVIFLAEPHNDMVAAAERDDRENLDRLRPGLSRTWDLLRFKYKFINDLSNQGPGGDSDADSGEGKPRVSLARFSENYRAMLHWVKEKGGQPLVVIPAVAHEDTAQEHYRLAIEKTVEKEGISSIDLMVLAKEKSDWLDSVHLSMRGHRKLMKAIGRLIDQDDLLAGSQAKKMLSAPKFTMTSLEPKTVTIGQERIIRLRLSGLNPEDLCRVWCGGLLTRFTWLKDGILELTLPRLMPARFASIELVTPMGSRVFDDAFCVLPPELRVELKTDGSMSLAVDLPEAVEIAYVATVMPERKPFLTEIGPLILSQGRSWPPPADEESGFYKDHVFAHGASIQQGLLQTAWAGDSRLPPGTSIAIQGLLAIPSPGDLVPISVTAAAFLVVPK